ncbi:MAG: hypothetical protein K2O15_00745 [Lachnospiraceae bacterium]|nr:hypothetical protein [Lachnospiraceae bacterium]
MTYTDEGILEKREQRKKEIYTTLEEGMYLGGEVVSFERKELFGIFSIMLPASWGQMPIEYAKIKYPSEFRPQIILTSENLDINMGFTAFSENVPCDDVGELTERIRSVIHRNNPDYLLYACENLPEAKGCWFSFRSHAMDSDLYNMMLMIPVKKRMVQGSFNCPYQDYTEWKKAVLMMWNSIMELEGYMR